MGKKKTMAEQRMSICNKCPVNVNGVCSKNKSGVATKTFMYGNVARYEGKTYGGCGCPLKAKTHSETSQCPLGRW